MNAIPRTRRTRCRPFGLLFCLPLTAALGCDLPGQPTEAERPVPPDKVLTFEALYNHNCAGCHGKHGRVGPAPPLNDPVFLAIVPDEVLLHVIAAGRPHTPMPAFALSKGGSLTQAQVKVLAAGIKSRWKSPGRASAGAPPYESEDEAEGNAAAGAKVFARACAGCHGDGGQGGKYLDKRIGAIADSAFLDLMSDEALRRLAITGRPDLGMPDYASVSGRTVDFKPLTSREITDLVAFLSTWRTSPSRGAER